MRGRKPKPTKLKLVQGNPGKRPLNTDEPKPRDGPGNCPPILKQYDRRAKAEDDQEPDAVSEYLGAVKCWHEITSVECWGQQLTRADRHMLINYCVLYARLQKAESRIRRFGEVVATPAGFPVPSPWVGIANKCRGDMHRIASEFGGTPSARTRIQVGKSKHSPPGAPSVPPKSQFSSEFG